MHPEHAPVAAAAEALAARFGPPPAVAIVLGSGLGAVVGRLRDRAEASYAEVGLPSSGVAGHAGRAIVGTLGKNKVCIFAGRVHLYEGHPAPLVVRGVRALHAWGVKHLILTCSVGGIGAAFDAGTFAVVTDHLNLQRPNPLVGEAYGTRFPDLGRAYDPVVRAAVLRAAEQVGARMAEGVLAAMPGPAYETPAEIRMLRALGADVVGMSTVPEVLAAAELGMSCAAVAVVSNRAAGLTAEVLTHEDVQKIAGEAADKLGAMLTQVCDDLG